LKLTGIDDLTQKQLKLIAATTSIGNSFAGAVSFTLECDAGYAASSAFSSVELVCTTDNQGRSTIAGQARLPVGSIKCVPITTYTVEYGDFSACDRICGGGMKTRGVTCVATSVAGVVKSKDMNMCDVFKIDDLTTECNIDPCMEPMFYVRENPPCSSTGILCENEVRVSRDCKQVVASGPSMGSLQVIPDAVCIAAGVRFNDFKICFPGVVCPSVAWRITGRSSTCSKTCGTGVKTLEFACLDILGASFDESLCAINKPPAEYPCNTLACPSLSSASQIFSPCTASCGEGTKSRSPICLRGMDSVDLELCGDYDSATYETTVLCEVAPCSTAAYVADVSACSATCGGGIFTTTYTCMDGDDMVGEALCEDNKPADTTEDCAINDCPTYGWTEPAFGDCSQTCAGGFQTREPACIEVRLQILKSAEDNCDLDPDVVNSKPASMQTCNDDIECIPTEYEYTKVTYTECTASCGDSVKNLTNAECIDSVTGLTADEALCASLEAPAPQKACNLGTCAFYWFTEDLGACSKTCGSGLVNRKVTCRLQNAIVADSLCSIAPPLTVEKCNTFACPAWNIKEGPCVGTCDLGSRALSTTCVDGQTPPQVYVDSKAVAVCGPRPAPSVSCPLKACDAWDTTPFGVCSKACGGGTQSRAVTCKLSNTCSSVSQPATTAICNSGDCTALFYQLTESAPCNALCDTAGLSSSAVGQISYTVSCRTKVGVVVDADCEAIKLVKPANTAVCSITCPVWRAQEFTPCSAFCPHEVTRAVQCGQAGKLVADALCKGTKPAVSKACTGSQGCTANGKCADPAALAGVAFPYCDCNRGYNGTLAAPCSIAPTFTNLKMTGLEIYGNTGEVAPGTQISISYQFTGDPMQQVKVLAYKGAARTGIASYLGLVLASKGQVTVNLTDASGAQLIVLEVSQEIFGVVRSLKVADPCAYYTCGDNGVRDFTACKDKKCNCLNGWSGPLCKVPPCSTGNTCKNGGVQNSTSCACTCKNEWMGKSCETCGLAATCDFGASADCKTCLPTCVNVNTRFKGNYKGVQASFNVGFEKDITGAGYKSNNNECEFDDAETTCVSCIVVGSGNGNNGNGNGGRRLLQAAVATGFAADLVDVNSDAANGVVTRLVDRTAIVQATLQPTAEPTSQPTAQPTAQPTNQPTKKPTLPPPTAQPTAQPTMLGTQAPVCENNFARFQCGSGVIEVTSAKFGSSDSGVCSSAPNNRGDCPLQSVLAAVAAACNGKKECDVLVSPSSLMFDPCVGSSKYLVSSYLCSGVAPVDAGSVVATLNLNVPKKFGPLCEGARLVAQGCPEGSSVVVTRAVFGRTNPTTCSTGVVMAGLAAPICDSDVTAFYRGRCNNKRECSAPIAPALLLASTSTTCREGYLEGTFMCVAN
jgi:hypothetical protein